MVFNTKDRILSSLVILVLSWIFTNCADKQDEENFKRAGHTAVWAGKEMIIWGGHSDKGYLNTGGRYNPESDTWLPVSIEGAPEPRSGHTAVWSGKEMIIWGGHSDKGYLNTGGRYNPESDTWLPVSIEGVPEPRSGHTAVWSGKEMIIWGGHSDKRYLNTGGRYNPESDTWLPVSIEGAPEPRLYHTAVWTEKEMIIWAGQEGGGRYNPETNAWTLISINRAPPQNVLYTGVWTGKEMIIWGGGQLVSISLPPIFPLKIYREDIIKISENYGYNYGGKYEPALDIWEPISEEICSSNDCSVAIVKGVWTGSEMLVWGDYDYRYNPESDTWLPITSNNAPSYREGLSFSIVWSGKEMIIWGGHSDKGYLNTGGRYNPESDTWLPVKEINVLTEMNEYSREIRR